MKRLIYVLVAMSIATGSVMAQGQGLTSDISISGDIRTGANYIPLLGICASDNVMLYTEVIAVHKSGFGAGYFAFDDFSNEVMGRIRFVDLLYTKSWEKFSLYTAMEYLWYDNDKNGECVMPYVIGDYNCGTWTYEVATMLTCFLHNETERYEFTTYLKVKKTLFEDLDLHATVWYDNLYNDNSHFYAGVGATLNLPKNFYVMGNALYKSNEVRFFLNLGWKFATD